MLRASDEALENPVLKEVYKTCIKIVDIIKEDSRDISDDILENHAAEYYGSICSTIMNTILINMVKGMDIPNREDKDEYYMQLVSELGKKAIEAYLIQSYSH